MREPVWMQVSHRHVRLKLQVFQLQIYFNCHLANREGCIGTQASECKRSMAASIRQILESLHEPVVQHSHIRPLLQHLEVGSHLPFKDILESLKFLSDDYYMEFHRWFPALSAYYSFCLLYFMRVDETPESSREETLLAANHFAASCL